MPVQYLDAPSIPLSYEELTSWAEAEASSQGVNINQYLATINERYPDADLTDFMIDETKKYLDFYQNEDGTYTVIGAYRDYQNTSYTNPVDSNSSQISRGSFRQAINNGVENVGGVIKRHMTPFPSSGSFGQKASYVIGSVGGAIGAATTGITLGKTIAPALYNAMPNVWESFGISEGSFDPENWATLTNGNDSPFAGLFNFIFGIDPDTGQTQAYMDENAFAYMAYAMKMNGFFDAAASQATLDDTTMLTYPNIPQPVIFDSISNLSYVSSTSGGVPSAIGSDFKIIRNGIDVSNDYWVVLFTSYHGSYYYCFTIEKTPSSYSTYSTTISYTETNIKTGAASQRSRTARFSEFYNADKTIRTMGNNYFLSFDGFLKPPYNVPIVNLNGSDVANKYIADIWYIITNGDVSSGAFPGVDNQPDATLPDISAWNDIPSTLQSLQNQYPDIFGNPLVWDNIQPDGTQTHARYVPVAMPNFNYNNDQQPVSASSTQTSPQLDSNTSTDTLLKAITDAIQATQTQTQPSSQIPPQNPVTTGTGEPPALVPPSGSASALWSVYHPTQAQVNSFGAWLWTDNIITQIQQLLQNPMEGIITLHKVFAPPVDSGQGTIVVGRLDSEVPSATVNQQYVTVDCGEIDCVEQFGNVFDYSPFTNISIYLPFIGIAPLSVNDIMRSKIHVKYGVDVFTGVCLAMVEVSRDGNTVNMYQYAGVASVEYPLTGTVHNGLITGIMGMVGGFATIATAGAAAPVAAAGGVAAAGAGALTTGRQSQSRSGNFSGNAGAMGIKTPYLIIERPQTKVAYTFPELAGYPTNKSLVLRECSGHVVVKHVHVEGVNATQGELMEIENLLQSGVLV